MSRKFVQKTEVAAVPVADLVAQLQQELAAKKKANLARLAVKNGAKLPEATRNSKE